MKVLVISHNVFSQTENMGRFLHDTFYSWPSDELCQLYFHSEVPTTNLCKEYFRITDFDILKSIRRHENPGHILGAADICKNSLTARIDQGREAILYQKGRARTSLTYLGRNFLWSLGTWKTVALDTWIHKCAPDIIYFASGDYAFSYRIAAYISEKYNIPIFTAIYDDFYFSATTSGVLSYIKNCQYKTALRKMLRQSVQVSYASDIMKQKYDREFELNGFVQYKSASISYEPEIVRSIPIISYAGGLSLNRWEALVEIGRSLREIYPDNTPWIDVYSGELNEDILMNMSNDNGIHFHGQVSATEIQAIVKDSNILLIVESSDKSIQCRIQCSLSTKVADYIGSNRCIFAYGPSGIGTIDYLAQNKCAVVINHPYEIQRGLRSIIENSKLRHEYAQKAIAVAVQNHSSDAICKKLQRELTARS